MDAKHDVENGHVTEMSQMMLSLIQDGYLVDIVNSIYKSISNVTKSGRADFAGDDQDAVVKAISTALIKSLRTNHSSITSLADTFIEQMAEDYDRYKTNLKIPFSAPTIKGNFISVITSALSKNSLRRHYPGLGTVQAPGYGFMQYIDLEMNGVIGTQHLTYEEACDQLRKLAHDKGKSINDCFVDTQSKNANYVTPDYINT